VGVASTLEAMAPLSLTARALGLIALIGLFLTTLMAAAATADTAPPEPEAHADVAAVGLDFEATNDVERWLGGSVDGVLTVTVANTGSEPATEVAGSAIVGDRTVFFPPVDIEPGETAKIRTDVSLGGMSFLERDIVAIVGDTQLATTHRSVPWLLVAIVGFAVNATMIAGRDQLRAMVRRRIVATPSGAPVLR
jgi:hypothetical protein